MLGLQTDSEMKVVVDRGQDEGGRDIRLQSAWGPYEGSRGRQRSRGQGPRAFFYQTRENQVQRCQYTCKYNTASRPSPPIRKQWNGKWKCEDWITESIYYL